MHLKIQKDRKLKRRISSLISLPYNNNLTTYEEFWREIDNE